LFAAVGGREDPNCEACSKPSKLVSSNNLAVSIWNKCNNCRTIDGMSGSRQPLKNTEIIAVRNEYVDHGATHLDYEKVLEMEDVVYPLLLKADKAEREKNTANKKK